MDETLGFILQKVFLRASLTLGRDWPHIGPIRKESYGPSSLKTSPPTLRDMGKRTSEETGLRLDSEKHILYPSSYPQTSLLCPSLMINGSAFPFQGEGHPSQLSWQCRPLPCQLKKKSLLLLSYCSWRKAISECLSWVLSSAARGVLPVSQNKVLPLFVGIA